MTAMRTGGWQHCRHESGTGPYYAAPHSKPEIALDASQLFLSRELWANNFYYFNPERDRIKEQGFSFIPTGAVEEMFLDTLINFMDVAKSHLAISLPVEIFAGLVAVNGFTLAVDRQYFGYEAFAGKILRQNVLHQDSLKKWTDDPFDSLLPFLKRSTIAPASSALRSGPPDATTIIGFFDFVGPMGRRTIRERANKHSFIWNSPDVVVGTLRFAQPTSAIVRCVPKARLEGCGRGAPTERAECERSYPTLAFRGL